MVSTFGYSQALIRGRRWREAAEVLEVGWEQVDEHGINIAADWLLCRRALAAAHMGDAKLAEDMVRETLAMTSPWANDSLPLTFLADTELQLGKLSRASELARRAIAEGGELHQAASVAWGSGILAEVMIRLGDGDCEEVRTALQQAHELSTQYGLASVSERLRAIQGR